MKSATEILNEHGINVMEMTDDFNTQLLHAMERYVEEKSSLQITPTKVISSVYFMNKEQFIEWFFNHSPYWATPDMVYDKLEEEFTKPISQLQKRISELEGEIKALRNQDQ